MRATGRLYGDEVIAQALAAAQHTLGQRFCHSFHCYFMRAGGASGPTHYHVERSRDGKSFSTRRITASQCGHPILSMICSFHDEEAGFEHSDPMPTARMPELCPDIQAINRDVFKRGDNFEPYEEQPWFDLRPVEPLNPVDTKRTPPDHRVWVRLKKLLATMSRSISRPWFYASDLTLAATAWQPHGVSWLQGLQSASLDHSAWFHGKTICTDWRLYVHHSPFVAAARGCSTGALYREDGV